MSVEALNELIDSYRDEVYIALKRGFGYELNLFMAMLITRYTRHDGTEYNIKEFTDTDWAIFGISDDDFNLDRDEERGLCCEMGMPRSPQENV